MGIVICRTLSLLIFQMYTKKAWKIKNKRDKKRRNSESSLSETKKRVNLPAWTVTRRQTGNKYNFERYRVVLRSEFQLATRKDTLVKKKKKNIREPQTFDTWKHKLAIMWSSAGTIGNNLWNSSLVTLVGDIGNGWESMGVYVWNQEDGCENQRAFGCFLGNTASLKTHTASPTPRDDLLHLKKRLLHHYLLPTLPSLCPAPTFCAIEN